VEYLRRSIDETLDELLPQLPAILLDGPKAVGKTTTASQRAQTIRRLDLLADQQRAAVESKWLVEGPKPILIDEWQRVPFSWELVRAAVDQDYSGGQFLLTGSLPDSGTHSGAGRITSLRMRPLSFAERRLTPSTISFTDLLEGKADIQGESQFGPSDYSEEIARSGFFGIRGKEGNALNASLEGYIERIIDSDVKEMGLSLRRPASLRAWLASFAAATATTAKWETIRDGANPGSGEPPAKQTVMPYRDALTRLRILDDLPAWLPTKNHFVRVASASKHYLADPALALRLLSLNHLQLSGRQGFGDTSTDKPLFGRMFEALVALSVRASAEARFARVMHFRDANGTREIDLIVERSDGKILAIEAKLGETVEERDFRHLNWLEAQIGNDLIDKVVIYSGKHAYRHLGVAVIPLALLGA
jgi:uncharacterized protein